ncbi:MAG: hypothetical protein JO128_05605, partial [Alphaproteobacteria bacterium]|nr:hypothetical protein [Alphaproteobacteria bacterium]
MTGRMTFTQPRSLTLSLAALTALLVASAMWPWLPSNRPMVPATSAAPAAERSAAPALPTITSFSDTVERPLFWPARRRLSASGPAAGATLFEQRYRLLGIVAIGDVRRAVLGDTGSHRTLELAEGGMLDGWTLQRIDAQSVTF